MDVPVQYPLKNKGKRAGLRAGFWLLLSSSVLTGCLEIPDTLLVSDNNQTTAARCQYPSLAQSAALPSSFSLLSWNIYKQQGDWQPELEQWLDNSELLVLQEAKASPELQDWLQLQDYRWSQVAAFNWKSTENGVLTVNTFGGEVAMRSALRSFFDDEPGRELAAGSALNYLWNRIGSWLA